MCGICGIFDTKSTGSKLDKVKCMTNAMVHRGPDDEGFYEGDGIAMGMRRLSIIDLASGHQPIFNEDKRYCVVLNGEIYNYIELKEQLVARGHTFSTNSDTEVIVHLFEEKREKCVEGLNGMFAFAVWDSQEKETYIFRDRIGIKPLFYTEYNGQFVFSSDLTALRKTVPVKEIDKEAFLSYLGFAYVPCPQTIFKGIRKLPPAHYLKLTAKDLSIEQYWSPYALRDVDVRSNKGCDELIHDELKRSVMFQLRSDVPVGTFLSGGLDSSSVVALLSELGVNDIKTFSLAFEGGYDELPYARLVSQRFNTDHFEDTLQDEQVPGIIGNLINFMDEPVSDNSIIPSYVLAKIARERGVKVILNGTGGDEIFGGYTRYNSYFHKNVLLKTPVFLRILAERLLSGVNKDKALKVRHPELMFQSSGVEFSMLQKCLADPNDLDKVKDLVLEHFKDFIPGPVSRRALMYFDLKSYLVDDVLSLLDKMTMAHSIEGRVPLLDHKLVELAYTIPEETIFQNKTLKGLLKSAVGRMLPSELLNQPKRGFSGPTAHWVKGVLYSDVYHHLIEEPADFIEQNIDLKSLKHILENIENSEHHSEMIFTLYIFTLWLKHNV